ncbi:NYN domain-containing protein [Desulfurobacterium sp.]
MKKVAILVDWDNLRGILQRALNNELFSKFNFNKPNHILTFLTSFLLEEEEIYRIFFYLAPPLRECPKGKDLTNTPTYHLATRFMENIAKQDLVALRKGKLKCIDGTPVQKQVDMLVGLDIAHLSYLRLVDRIFLVSLDSDFIPAIRIARLNGIQVIIPAFSPVQYPERELQEHADFVRNKELSKLDSLVGGGNCV